MALATWPAGVPHIPRLDDLQPIQRVLDPISTEMEGGNQRQRARPGDDVGVLPYTLQMTISQFQTFTTWWRTTLNNGTARFTADIFDGTGCITKTCQFTADGRPKDKYVGSNLIQVSMQLRVYGI
jgi:hypothetical protein